MKRLLLVDGSNLLFQMFYGMPSRIIGKDGRQIQGTLGFVGALLKIIRMTCPSHIAVFFDGEHENDRAGILADYKANRPDYSQMAEEDTPFSQLGDICSALDCLGITYRETTDCEADDLIAGYVYKYRESSEIIISSNDSDFFQLIGENVRVLRYRGDNSVICNSDYISSKLGIPPERYAEYKSLTGDSADNIRGCEKVGPKTAAELVLQFSSIEEMLARCDEIKKPSVRKAVSEAGNRLLLNRTLIKLCERGELPFDIDRLLYQSKQLSTREVLTSIGLF